MDLFVDPRSFVLTYSRPIGAMTLPPPPVWSVSLACYVRPQPVEFIEIPTSAGFHQGASNAIPAYQRSTMELPEVPDILDSIELPPDLEVE